MAYFTRPLTVQFPSGDVSQWFQMFSPTISLDNSPVSFFSVNLGQSSASEVEDRVLNEVGSYGKQLGKIGDVMAIIVSRMVKEDGLSPEDEKALWSLKLMLDSIESIKKDCGRG